MKIVGTLGMLGIMYWSLQWSYQPITYDFAFRATVQLWRF